MVIIKLGGSLSKSNALTRCLNAVDGRYRNRKAVIVPGGGAFADQVRLAQQCWRFNDNTAHQMALLAMQQMALMFKGLKPHFAIGGSVPEILNLLDQKKTVIWSPDTVELGQAGIKAGWDITSDSLAAWLANTLSASELILVKSAKIEADRNVAELARQKLIDASFCDFVSKSPYKITIINYQDF